MKPDISVLIPAYNAENTISAAVWSVLNQSFNDFELLVCIDGATDKTIDLVAGISDTRLRVMVEGFNKGIAQARNRLLKEATGNYIAWLDADDIMLPGRLAEQFDYMQSHPEVDILAGWAELRNSKLKKVVTGIHPEFIKTSLLFRNPFVQSSIMAKNFFVQEGLLFDPAFDYIEDYDLYLRCLSAGKQFAALPRFVVSYRLPGAEESEAKNRQYKLDEKQKNLLLRTHPGLEAEDASVILGFIRNNQQLNSAAFKVVRRFLVRLKRQLRRNKQWGVGVAAALLYQRFRLIKLRFGLVRALLRLAGTRPAIVRLMLKNRTRWQ
jgi:glycosyltransferase involved in cell wall biosynthesis